MEINNEHKDYQELLPDTSTNTTQTKPTQIKSINTNKDNKLYSTWNLWYVSRKQKDHSIPYEYRLKNIGEINTIEDFLKKYIFMKPPMDMARNIEISLFKSGYKPLWEECPRSGIVFLRIGKSEETEMINLIWEVLLFSLVGEAFDESAVLGSTLSIRNRETIIELWFNYDKNEKLKMEMVNKFKEIVVEKNQHVNIFFKDNSLSVNDRSTLKNVEQIDFVKRKNTHI